MYLNTFYKKYEKRTIDIQVLIKSFNFQPQNKNVK